MKVLAIGDIFGKLGRRIIQECLAQVKKDYQIDLVVANVENVTHGKGISQKHYQELKEQGIDLMTSGNHLFHLEETRKNFEQFPDLIRPLNSNPFYPGSGTIEKKCKEKKIRITNLIGVSFMPPAENPYLALEKLLQDDDSDIHLIDFHGEATAEKVVLAHYLDQEFKGKITAVWGTHTHVQTADERILPNGTAFLTDLGMTGASEGIIGAEYSGVIKRSKYGFSAPLRPCQTGSGQFNGLILTIDKAKNQVISLQRLNFKVNFS